MKKHIKLTAILTIAAIVLTFVNVPTAKAQQTATNCGLFSSIKEDFSGKEMSQKKYKKKCKKRNYKKLKKNPEKYKGKYIKAKGKIVNVEKGVLGSYYTIIIKAKKKQYYEVTLTKLNQGYKNYVEGLTMTVWGKCAGNADYKLGHKDVTMPSIDAKYEKLVLKLFG